MIYIHIPFCRSFCTYCGFYSEVANGECGNSFSQAITSEARERASEIIESNGVNTLYIGGGTPSVLPLSVLFSIVEALPIKSFKEFTIEVNPEDIVDKGLDYVKGLRTLGVNRVSMGIQSFDDGLLKWMNRRHNSKRAIEAFRLLREGGFDNVSIDLIFGLSNLSDSLWEETLKTAISLQPEHISAYQLSIEEGSALDKLIRDGRYIEADENQCRGQYEALCRALKGEGYTHYEVSNFAKPGKEALHNSAYWERVQYVGLGPGAHSLRGDVRSWNSESISNYSPEKELLSQEDINLELVMLGLRTAKGISEAVLRGLCDNERIEKMLSDKVLARENRQIRIPESHFFISDEIIRELI